MGQLADRLAHLTTRYGSDAAAWQHEIHALAALETGDTKLALERFHALKRRLAEFRRAQLLRELRRFSFALDVPSEDTRGYPVKEIEADIRAASRALTLAREIERAAREEEDARASLRRRALSAAAPLAGARWDALAPLADAVEVRRRAAMREARLDRRLDEAARRAAKLAGRIAIPDAAMEGDALDAALDEVEALIARAQALEEAHARSVAPLRAPEVATYRHASRRKIEAEARALWEAGDVEALRGLEARAEALRREAAALASQAARARRSGRAPPEGERRPRDGIDPYG